MIFRRDATTGELIRIPARRPGHRYVRKRGRYVELTAAEEAARDAEEAEDAARRAEREANPRESFQDEVRRCLEALEQRPR